jgi:hypothetical protein
MKTESDTHFELDEPLRFPVGTEGWEGFDPFILQEQPRLRIPTHDYAKILKPRSKADDLDLVAKLIEKFPADYSATQILKPEAWRLLHYRHSYVLDCLTAFRFHATDELRRICDTTHAWDDPPLEWIGTMRPLHEVAEEAEYAVRCLRSDAAKAAWTILAVAQLIPLSKTEVLRCEWWNPRWIQSLAACLDPSI